MARVVDRWHDKNRNRTKRFGIGKRWMAVWGENGKEVTRAFQSRDAAQAHLTRTSHEIRAGDYVNDKQAVSFDDYWPRFITLKRNLSSSTRTMYDVLWAGAYTAEVGGHAAKNP